MSLRSELPCCEIHYCEAPNVMRFNWKTYCDSVSSVFDWLDKCVIEGTDEPSRILVLITSLCQIAMLMSLMPHLMKKCAQSMLRLLNLPALFIHGNLDIYFFDHLVSDFQHVLSSAHQDRKMTNPRISTFFHIQKLFFGSDHGWREHAIVSSSPSKFLSRTPVEQSERLKRATSLLDGWLPSQPVP